MKYNVHFQSYKLTCFCRHQALVLDQNKPSLCLCLGVTHDNGHVESQSSCLPCHGGTLWERHVLFHIFQFFMFFYWGCQVKLCILKNESLKMKTEMSLCAQFAGFLSHCHEILPVFLLPLLQLMNPQMVWRWRTASERLSAMLRRSVFSLFDNYFTFSIRFQPWGLPRGQTVETKNSFFIIIVIAS